MIPECHKLFPVVNNGGHELLGFHAAEYGKYSVSGRIKRSACFMTFAYA